MTISDLNKLSDEAFKRTVGVKRLVFSRMVKLVESQPKTAGRPHKLPAPYEVLITLLYYKEYRTYHSLGVTYNVHQSTIGKIIERVENILLQNDEFNLIKQNHCVKNLNTEVNNVILVDCTECRIERPKVNQSEYYSGKKKSFNQSTSRL